MRRRQSDRGVFGIALFIIAALLLTMPLSACGRKGGLEPPPGTESSYPRQYPNPEEQ